MQAEAMVLFDGICFGSLHFETQQLYGDVLHSMSKVKEAL